MEEQKYLTQDEMLDYMAGRGIKKSKSWAEHARFNRRGPKFVRFGGHVRTTKKWIDEWIDSCLEEVATND